MKAVYRAGYCITWVLTFLVCWIFIIARFGFTVGLVFGWLPSLIVATTANSFWPLLWPWLAMLGLSATK